MKRSCVNTIINLTAKKEPLNFLFFSEKTKEYDNFIPYFKHKNGCFTENITGTGDAYSYVSGNPVQTINVTLKNIKDGSLIDIKVHDHWHSFIFKQLLKNEIHSLKVSYGNKFVTGEMYKGNRLFKGKVFHFEDEMGTKLSFFAFSGELINHQPYYFRIIDRLKTELNVHYYNLGNFEHRKHLKQLDFRKLVVSLK